MQKLIYQNTRGEEIVFMHAPYVLGALRGIGFPDVKLAVAAGAYQQGETIVSSRREARTIKVTLHLMAQTREEMYRLRAQLCGALSPALALDGDARAKIIYENDHGRWWTWAFPENGLDWGKRMNNIQQDVSLSFSCESPYWHGEKNAAVFRASQSGFGLPMRFPVAFGSRIFELKAVNMGHAETSPTISFTGCGETPLLLNKTTGARIALTAPLPLGDTLTVRTDPVELGVRVRHASGAEENAFGLLNPETSIAGFVLRPGANQLVYTPNGDSSRTEIRIEWFDRYEGV